MARAPAQWAAAAAAAAGLAVGEEAVPRQQAYLASCQTAMMRQLTSSHIRDAECQRRVTEVYCSKLLDVEQPRPLRSECPLNIDALSSPSYPIEGHLPSRDALEAQYRIPGDVVFGILILVFYRHLVHLVQHLVRSLWDEKHTFLIHVDPKADPRVEEELRGWLAAEPGLAANVHVRSRVAVKRSGASLLAAELYGLCELLRLSAAWHYFLVLSDSDQLVRPLSFLQRYLSLHWGESFINTEVLNGKPRSLAVECPERVHSVRVGGHEEAVPTRPGLTLASGSQFVVLFREFAEFASSSLGSDQMIDHLVSSASLLRNSSSFAGQVLDEVRMYASPDETFFHTLAVNSRFCTSHARFNFHFHDTKGNILDEASQRYTDFPTGSPPVLAEGHLPLLLEVRAHHPLVFARKFDTENSSSAALLTHVGELARPRAPRWRALEGGAAFARAAAAALLGPRCSPAAASTTARQLERPPEAAFDISPAAYVLPLHGVPTDCLDLRLGTALRGRSRSAQGELWLGERYAVPSYPEDARGIGAEATANSPLVWLRVGSGWDMQRLRFRGAASVAGTAEAWSSGLSAVMHWRLAGVPRSLRVRWTGPRGAELVVEESLPEWSLLGASRAPFRSEPEPGWWSVEVAQRPSGRRGHVVVGSRRLFLFGAEGLVPADALEMFFHPMAAPLDTPPRQGRPKRSDE